MSHQRAAVVADDDAVRVQHGHDLEDEGAAQELGVVVIADEKVDDAVHEPGGVRLARVHPRRQDD